MRASLGQKVLKLETVNAGDGATLTQNQAIKRWAFLFGPTAAGIVLAIIPGLVGPLLSLLAFAYAIYLLYTTSQSPKRQGFTTSRPRPWWSSTSPSALSLQRP